MLPQSHADGELQQARGGRGPHARHWHCRARRRPGRHRITLGADKLFDVEAFVGDLLVRRVTPHIAIDGAVFKTGKVRKTVIDGRTTRHPGYAIKLHCRQRIEQTFGWIKTHASFAKVKVRSLPKVEAVFTFAAVAYNLVRLPKLLAGALV